MTINEVKAIIKEYGAESAFIIGNGLNRYYYNDTTISWEKLLLDIWNKVSDSKLDEIPTGISFTEFYDVLQLNIDGSGATVSVQKEVKKQLSGWHIEDKQNKALDKIFSLKAPILTTNFDDLIPQYLGLKKYKIENSHYSDYYPWSTYYSNETLNSPVDGFGVWYINGMINYERSIKLGLAQYMGNVDKAKHLILSGKNNIYHQQFSQQNWAGIDTWLDIIFNKPLFIFGLMLDETEVFLRWILIERAKYFKKFPELKQKAWFITPQNECSNGKKFFLNSIGFEVLDLIEFKNINEEIWDF